MIDHDHVDPGRLGLGKRLEGLRAAIDGDDQGRAALGDPHQCFSRRPIALHQPVRDIGLRLEPELAQQADQQGGRGGAVHVIIAEDGDRLAPLDRVGDARGRLVHVLEDGRVGHEGAKRRRPVAGEIVATDAARHQQLVDQVVGLVAGIARVGVPGTPAPRLPEDRARHAADEVGGHQHRREPRRAGP